MTQGRVILDTYDSTVLKNNPLNDPHQRQLAIYLPPGYDNANRDYPVVFLLPGFSGKGIMMLNREAFSEAIDQRLDRLISTKRIQPMIVVMPDCFTYYGGSQYRDSVALGQYETYITQELVPYIKNKFKLDTKPSSWAIAGKSSGGYGALAIAMHHPDIFGITACHSGDLGFEYCYLPDFPEAMLTIEKNGGVSEFMKNFYALPKKDGNSFLTLNVLAMAAAYSPNPQHKPHLFDLPFNLQTGELLPNIWQQWLACDPLRMIDAHLPALRQLKIFIDCGKKDEYRLYAGARMFSAKLEQLGIKHCHEEFDDTHMRTSYRYDRSLAFISEEVGIG